MQTSQFLTITCIDNRLRIVTTKHRGSGYLYTVYVLCWAQGSEDDEFHMEGSSDSDLSDIGKGEGEDEDEDAEARDGDENDEGEGEDLADEDNDWDSEDIGERLTSIFAQNDFCTAIHFLFWSGEV